MEDVKVDNGILDGCNFSIGNTVYVGTGTERIGKIAFVGNTHFATGIWVGVNLFSPNGRNNGSVDGKIYFECEPNHGIFAKYSNVRLTELQDLKESCSEVIWIF